MANSDCVIEQLIHEPFRCKSLNEKLDIVHLADLALICLALQQRTKTKVKVTFGIFKRHRTLKRNVLQEVQNLTCCFAGHVCCLQVNKLFGPTMVMAI
jgi:hypothetical protein